MVYPGKFHSMSIVNTYWPLYKFWMNDSHCADQEAYDPYNSDAGDGMFPNGSWVTPPAQSNVYTSWNTSLAAAMLKSMPVKPDIVTGQSLLLLSLLGTQWAGNVADQVELIAVDNEIEIASSTHQDMHPDPMGYEEELARVIRHHG